MLIKLIFVTFFLSNVYGEENVELKNIKISPKNPVVSVFGPLRFRFKKVPTDYEIHMINAVIRNSQPKLLFHSLNSDKTTSITEYEGRVLYADIEEAILFNLSPDFNGGKIQFIFIRRFDGSTFQVNSPPIKILPQVELISVKKASKKFGFPFKNISMIERAKTFDVDFTKTTKDHLPINKIALLLKNDKQGETKNIADFIAGNKLNNIDVKYDSNKNKLIITKNKQKKRLTGAQIFGIRDYENVYQVFSSGELLLQKFYKNFRLRKNKISWKVFKNLRHQIDFQMFVYNPEITNTWEKAITFEKGKPGTIESKFQTTFSSANDQNAIFTKCPSMTKFLLRFHLKQAKLIFGGNTPIEEVEFLNNKKNCPQDIQEQEAMKTVDVKADKKFVKKKITMLTKKEGTSISNIPTVNGKLFCLKDSIDTKKRSKNPNSADGVGNKRKKKGKRNKKVVPTLNPSDEGKDVVAEENLIETRGLDSHSYGKSSNPFTSNYDKNTLNEYLTDQSDEISENGNEDDSELVSSALGYRRVRNIISLEDLKEDGDEEDQAVKRSEPNSVSNNSLVPDNSRSIQRPSKSGMEDSSD